MYDLYRYIEHVTHMCLRSWSVLYSDHLNLEIPVDIKKKNIVSARCRMCMLCQSLSLLMEIPIERSNYLTLLCVWLEADITLLSLHANFSHFIYTPKIKAHRTHLSKKLRRDMYMYACTFIIFEFIGWKTRGFLKISVPLFRDIFPPKSRCGH